MALKVVELPETLRKILYTETHRDRKIRLTVSYEADVGRIT